jgi:hypothetical protein
MTIDCLEHYLLFIMRKINVSMALLSINRVTYVLSGSIQ